MDAGGQVLGALFTFVLAGLLGPREFGILALAMVYVLFVDMLQRQGMAAALIQRRDLTAAHLDSAFWLVLGLSVVLTAGSIGLSGWWAAVNSTPQLQSVIVALSALLPVQALIIVQDAILRRALQFRALAVRNNVAAVVGGVCGVGAAFAGLGVWALVVQQLVTAVVRLVILWHVAEWQPRMRFSVASLRDLAGFSAGSFLSSVAVFVNNRSDALLTGLFFGPVAIGLYRLGYRLLDQVLSLSLSGRSLAAVALPELSHHQDDDQRFAERVEKLLHLSVASALPLLGILAAVAGPVLALIGDEWVPATGAVQVLCVVGAVRAFIELVGPVLQARGRPHRQAALTWLLAGISAGSYVVVGLLLTAAPARAQVLSMAVSRAVVYVAVLGPIAVAIFSRYGGVRPTVVLRTVARPAAASLGGCAAGLLAGRALPLTGGLPGKLLALLCTGGVATIVTFGLLIMVDRQVRPHLAGMWVGSHVALRAWRRPRRDGDRVG
jgi:PST family polysaccharide transporter